MNDCAESQTKVCSAHIKDCYGRVAMSYNKCKSSERDILKKNICEMLDKFKDLLNTQSKGD